MQPAGTAVLEAADEQMLAQTPPAAGMSPLLIQMAAEASQQGDAASSASKLLVQPIMQPSASSASASGSDSTTARSSVSRTSSWQPERTQVGFSVQQLLQEPCMTQPIAAPILPPVTMYTAAAHQQQVQDFTGLSDPAAAAQEASITKEQLLQPQQSEHMPALPHLQFLRRQRTSSTSSNSNNSTPRSSGIRTNSSIGVSPGLQARIKAAELAAAGRFDPVSWAAAEAEAIQADTEAAAAAAREAQQQHVEEELQKRRAEAARVALQLAEAKGHFSPAPAAEATVQTRHQHQQQQDQHGALMPLFQLHRKSVPGRLVMTDCSDLPVVPTADSKPSCSGVDPAAAAAPGGGAQVSAAGAVYVDAVVASGASPSSMTSLPPPELLLQDISLVVTSSLFEGSRGSSPQPGVPVIGAPMLGYGSNRDSLAMQGQPQQCQQQVGLDAATDHVTQGKAEPGAQQSSSIATDVGRLLLPAAGRATAQQQQPQVTGTWLGSTPQELTIDDAASGPAASSSAAAGSHDESSLVQSNSSRPRRMVVASGSSTFRKPTASGADKASSPGVGTPTRQVTADQDPVMAGYRRGSKRPAALDLMQQGHHQLSQQQQQRSSSPSHGAAAASKGIKAATRSKPSNSKTTSPRTHSTRSPGQHLANLAVSGTAKASPAQSPRSPASATAGLSPQQSPKSPVFKKAIAFGTSSGTTSVSPGGSPRSSAPGTAGVLHKASAMASPAASPSTQRVAASRPAWNSNTKAESNASNGGVSGKGVSSSVPRSPSGTQGGKSPLASPPVSPSARLRVSTGLAAPSRIPTLGGSSSAKVSLGGNSVSASLGGSSSDLAAANSRTMQQLQSDDEATVTPKVQNVMREHSSLRPASPPAAGQLLLQSPRSFSPGRLAATGPAAIASHAPEQVLQLPTAVAVLPAGVDAAVDAAVPPPAASELRLGCPLARVEDPERFEVLCFPSSTGGAAALGRAAELHVASDSSQSLGPSLDAETTTVEQDAQPVPKQQLEQHKAVTSLTSQDSTAASEGFELVSPHAAAAQQWPQSHLLDTVSYGVDTAASSLVTAAECSLPESHLLEVGSHRLHTSAGTVLASVRIGDIPSSHELITSSYEPDSSVSGMSAGTGHLSLAGISESSLLQSHYLITRSFALDSRIVASDSNGTTLPQSHQLLTTGYAADSTSVQSATVGVTTGSTDNYDASLPQSHQLNTASFAIGSGNEALFPHAPATNDTSLLQSYQLATSRVRANSSSSPLVTGEVSTIPPSSGETRSLGAHTVAASGDGTGSAADHLGSADHRESTSEPEPCSHQLATSSFDISSTAGQLGPALGVNDTAAPVSHKLATSSFGIDTTASCLGTGAGSATEHHSDAKPQTTAPATADVISTSARDTAAVAAAVAASEDAAALPLHHYLKLSTEEDCLMMPPELVVGRLSPRSSGPGCIAAAALSRTTSAAGTPAHSRGGSLGGVAAGPHSHSSSIGGSLLGHASDVAASAAHSRKSSLGGAAVVPNSHSSSIGGSLLGDASRHVSGHGADQGPDTQASAAAGAATAVTAALPGDAKGSVSANTERPEQQQHQQCTVMDGSSEHSSAKTSLSPPPLSSTDSNHSSTDKPQASHQSSSADSQPQQQQRQQQSAGATGIHSEQLEPATAEASDVMPQYSGVSPADLQLSPQASGTVPYKLMSRQSSTQSLASDSHASESLPLREQHTNSPSHFMMSLSLSVSCSPRKSGPLEATYAASASDAAASSTAGRGSSPAARESAAAAAGIGQVADVGTDSVHDLLQQLTAAAGLQQYGSDDQEQQQQQQQQRVRSGGLSGHQQLQQLIPQRPRPRQQQEPARIITWAGSDITTTTTAAAAAAAAPPQSAAVGAAASVPEAQYAALAVNNVSSNANAASMSSSIAIRRTGSAAAATAAAAYAGHSTGCNYTLPASSLPMAILKPSSSRYGRSGISIARSSSVGSSGELAESGGRHRDAAALSAMIAEDSRITSSFKHALLESICSRDDSSRVDALQQEQREHGGKRVRSSCSNSGWQQQLDGQQQQQISTVVAFSFPRTSSTPAFGNRGRMAPSLSGGAAGFSASPERQQQQQRRVQSVRGSHSTGIMNSSNITAAAAAAAAGISHDDSSSHTGWSSSNGNRRSSTDYANGASMAILSAAPMLRISSSSGNIQCDVYSQSVPNHHQNARSAQQGFISGLAKGCQGLAGLAAAQTAFGFSPISEGTNLTVTSTSSSGDGSAAAAELQQQQQQEKPPDMYAGPATEELLGLTESQQQQQQPVTWHCGLRSDLTDAATGVSSEAHIAGSASSSPQQQPQQNVLHVGSASSTAGSIPSSKRQQGLLSAQMRRSSTANMSPAAAAAECAGGCLLVLPASPPSSAATAAASSEGSTVGAAPAEDRVRGSSSAAAALLGLQPDPLPASSPAASWTAELQQQQLATPTKKSRVSWADDENGLSFVRCVISPAAAASDSTAQAGGAVLPSEASLDAASPAPAAAEPKTDMHTASSSPKAAPATPTAAAAASPATPGSAGLPPAGPSRTIRRRSSGLMRTSKSCGEFSSLIAAAAEDKQTLAAAVSSGGSSGGGSSGRWSPKQQQQQQQQSVNVFTEAFAAKGSLAGIPPTTAAVLCGSSSSPGEATAAVEEQLVADAAVEHTYRADHSSSKVVAVPGGSSKLISLSGAGRSRSAPTEISLLSCSWHEIEPLLDEDDETKPHQHLRHPNPDHGSRLGFSRGAVGLNQGLAELGFRGSGAARPAMYSYDGDFYGGGSSSRGRSSSFTGGYNGIQPQQQQQQQQPGFAQPGGLVVSSRHHQQHQQQPANGAVAELHQLQAQPASMLPQTQQQESVQQKPAAEQLASAAASAGSSGNSSRKPRRHSAVAGASSSATGSSSGSSQAPKLRRHSAVASGWFGYSWLAAKPVSMLLWRQQQQHGERPAVSAPSAHQAVTNGNAPTNSSAGQSSNAADVFDLSSLMLLGQLGPGESARALRRALDSQTGGGIAQSPY